MTNTGKLGSREAFSIDRIKEGFTPHISESPFRCYLLLPTYGKQPSTKRYLVYFRTYFHCDASLSAVIE
jgi:hypothetical protein